MKEMAYRLSTSLKRRRRIISFSEKTDSKDCTTVTYKTFVYLVDKDTNAQRTVNMPVFYITKIYNSKSKVEKFIFRVKGEFYMNRDRQRFLVHYCHSLKIDIVWKKKIPIPNSAH